MAVTRSCFDDSADTLCTSGFVDDVIFCVLQRIGQETMRMLRPVRQMTAPVVRQTMLLRIDRQMAASGAKLPHPTASCGVLCLTEFVRMMTAK